MNKLTSLIYLAYFDFAVQYRKTMIGPVWVLVGPTLFILTLGLLFGEVSNSSSDVFIPHLTIGLITWTLISGFVTGSTTVFQRNRAQIMHGGMSLLNIAAVDVIRTIIHFLHQIIIVIVVFVIYDLNVALNALVALIGLMVLVINGVWLTLFFGMVGARYRDLSEIVTAVMRIAFLATPIIWLPAERGAGGIMGAFLTYNPFYHYLDIVRAPLLGHVVTLMSVQVVGGITITGIVVTYLFYRRLHFRVPLWV
ncbi:MAG: ABC transporter permease [Gammaproteobacteria bacterium]|nr:ABC transporter permease [Gammaproteobacteria bacterium]MBT7878657.1 ABC transporter permease [Gammaproteobacteria bacterium]